MHLYLSGVRLNLMAHFLLVACHLSVTSPESLKMSIGISRCETIIHTGGAVKVFFGQLVSLLLA